MQNKSKNAAKRIAVFFIFPPSFFAFALLICHAQAETSAEKVENSGQIFQKQIGCFFGRPRLY
jgi:hypothetical protein